LGGSPMGLLLPAFVALAMQLAQMLPLPVAVRLAMPGYAFIAWRGLFTSPSQLSALLISIVVSLAWAATATAAAYVVFRGRDFTSLNQDGSGRRAISAGVLPLVGLVAVTIAAVVLATPAAGSGIEQDKVQRSLATAFSHLYRLQTKQLNRPDVAEAQLRTSATCTKGGGMVTAQGPGNDWRCIVSWHLPDVDAVGTAIYQLDVSADGRFVADGDGPKEVNGYFLVRTPTGNGPNPLWQFDGIVELLSPTPKG
jgi:ABC-2 type transport system permease protein